MDVKILILAGYAYPEHAASSYLSMNRNQAFAEENFKDKISFCRLEVEEQEALADLFQTVGIPTFVLFKDGKEIGRIIGYRQKAKFVDEIANIIRDGQ